LIGALRAAGYRTVAVRCERIFQQVESAASSIGGGSSLGDLKKEALSAIHDLQSQRRPSRVKPAATLAGGRLRSTTSAIVGIALASTMFASAQVASATELDNAQRQAVLTEADKCYSEALAAAATDSAEAKQAFADAATKYELVADSGVANSRLYINLGNAYLQSGKNGRAIANYRRALRLDPTNSNARTNLAYAESLLKKADSKSTHQPAASVASFANLANGWLSRFVRPSVVLATAIIGWILFWTAIGLRLCEVRFPWKTLAACSLLVAIVAAASYAASYQSASRPEAVVVATSAELKTGDGASFPNVASATVHEGQPVEWLKRRGDWVQVRTSAGQSGWLADSAVEVL
jgi:tetratricopeptide (TPR) repeat protein